MYDIVYEFINETFLGTTIHSHSYFDELALLLTHTTMVLFYLALVALIIHIFNAFRTMTRWW
jgi:succinate dehydrogenase/fumarate reductase cytochrome b subunit